MGSFAPREYSYGSDALGQWKVMGCLVIRETIYVCVYERVRERDSIYLPCPITRSPVTSSIEYYVWWVWREEL